MYSFTKLEDEKLCKKVLYLMSKFPLHQKLWAFKDPDNSPLHTLLLCDALIFLPLILQRFIPYKERNQCFGSMKWTGHYKEKPRCGFECKQTKRTGNEIESEWAYRNLSSFIGCSAELFKNKSESFFKTCKMTMVEAFYCMNILK